jgi:uroporphyrinogen-III decarboxylase
MTSKERVRNAIAKLPVDKVPLGTYLMDCDTISAVIGRETYLRNNPEYQIAIWEGRRDEAVESMKEDLKDLFSKLDCIDLITFKEARIVAPKGFILGPSHSIAFGTKYDNFMAMLDEFEKLR